MHAEDLADAFARFNAGSNSAARMAMTATTTRNSIEVNPLLAMGVWRVSFRRGSDLKTMLKSVEGIYIDGVIKLAEQPDQVVPGAHAIVTFLPKGEVDLRAYGIDAAGAAELRGRLSAFAEDWENPEMSAYDNYHAAKSRK